MGSRRLLRMGALAVALVSSAMMLAAQQQKQLPNIGAAGQLGPKPPVGSGGCSVTAPTCADVAPGIIQRALGASPLEGNLRHLTDVIGGRVTGSAAEEQAVNWAVEAFKKAGVDDVHTESYTIPVRWSAGPASLTILAPEGFPVRLASAGWSPATPAGGLTAPVVDVGMGTEADFARVGARAHGALLLVHTKISTTWDDLFGEYGQLAQVTALAPKAGAAGILWMASRPYLITYRLMLSMTGEVGPLPMAIVAREDALRMEQFLHAGTAVRARLVLANKIGGTFEAQNVVAEIKGREKPDEYVILGAHLDSWELGTGALDNGCNAAMVIDAARAIHAAGTRPLRSIRFILFTGEEQGMLGSWAYARAHWAEMDKIDGVIIYDSGDGKVTGYELGGRPEIEPAVRKALAPAAQFGADHDTDGAEMGTDNFDFLLEGVPSLVANQEPAGYMINYHAISDTFDKVDIAAVKREEALAAITAYGIADLPERLGKRQSRAEVQELLRKTGLEEQMKAEGIWSLWEGGKRP
ncbi:MAG: M20/M25/M40 family metallo-hydrolase [Acidobacteriota bacterium]|nr:M20/M25/M40 family metallo-hydrolase [Acidobacteriota bacterium]